MEVHLRLFGAAHPAFIAESDQRITQIHDQDWEMVNWIDDDSKATSEMVETFISLYRQKNLHAGIGRAYKHAVEVYSGNGKKFEVIKYARLAVGILHLSKGFSHPDIKMKKEMASNPETRLGWNTKARQA